MPMSKEFKTLPVKNEEDARAKIAQLSEKYHLTRLLPDDPYRVYSTDYTVYYDREENLIRMETAHPGVTEEQIREFLIHFPPFV
jgi:hypothetical protein